MPTARALCLFFFFGFLALLYGAPGAASAQPELSTGPGQPIEFDSERGALVAKGDAQLRDGPVLVRADEIGFYQQEQRAEAVGNVEVTREGLRLLAERLDYHFETEAFEGRDVRAGVHPVYIEGARLEGTPTNVIFRDARIWLGEPHPWGLNISASQLSWDEIEGIDASSPVFRFGPIPFLVLPRFSHSMDSFPLRYSGGFGYRSNLGLYLRNEVALPVAPGVFIGGNLDGYTERGVLGGPVLDWSGESPDAVWRTSLNTGFINDSGDRGFDTLGRPIDEDRYWVEARHHLQVRRDFTLNAALSWWSDSEVTRDFRPDFFFQNQSPDSFAEAMWFEGPFSISAFLRVRPNDFQIIRERLPELRIDMAPVLHQQTGIYQSGALSFTSLRRRTENPAQFLGSPPALPTPEDMENQSTDLHYTLQRPIRVARGVTFTPRLGTRLTHYADTLFDQGSTNRWLAEIGFDLEALAHATWEYENRVWKIDGLRHRVRPLLQYRYLPRIDDSSKQPLPVDVPVLSFNRLPINLDSDRQIDFFQQRHLMRMGVEQVLQTRHENYGSRDLARLGVYQDLLLELQPGQDRLDSFWTELQLTPAPWLEFSLFSRSLTQDLKLSEINTRLRVTDADIWSLGLANQYVDGRIDQWFVEFSYRFSERFGIDTLLRWDRRLDTLTEQFYALTQQFGNSIVLAYGVRIREGSVREDDVNFSLQVSFLDL